MRARFAVLLLLVFAMSPTVEAKEIVVIGHSNEPMFTKEGSGREGDVITAALEQCGHSVRFIIQPFVRHWSSFKKGTGDAVSSVPVGMDLGGTPSEPYFYYQNGITILSGKSGPMESVAQLKGKKVVAFKGANYIVPELKGITDTFAQYRELPDQSVHVKLLFTQRVDAVVGDGMILANYIHSLRDRPSGLSFDPSQKVEFNATFAPSPRVLQFRDSELAQEFNRCFKEVEADGKVAEINSRWAGKFRDILSYEYMGY